MTALAPVVAVGGGRMGRGIAVAHALHEVPVTVLDLKPRSNDDFATLADAIHQEVRDDLDRLVHLGALGTERLDSCRELVTVAPVDAATDVLGEAALVFEGVPERLDAKRAAFDIISKNAGPDVVVGSTTSAVLATELAGMVECPERFLNAHWLNPAFVVPLVELSVHPGTDVGVVARVREHLESIDKVPVVCGASPGYIVPRLQALIMNEAARMVEEGVASAAEIDTATRHGLGFRFASLGVLEFIDYGGNDTLYHASHYLAEHVDEHRYAVPDIVARHHETGRNGLRDGRGFHEYPAAGRDAYRTDVLSRLLDCLPSRARSTRRP